MKRQGFTLIELLVVIAIIAMLLGIMLPSLRLAKAKVREVYSLANIRSLTVCWLAYAQDNDSKMVRGECDPWSNEPEDWIQQPLTWNADRDHRWEVEGIRAGALWPYVENLEAYHSPGDPTKLKEATVPYDERQSPYRSYAISDPMNGDYLEDYQYNKITDVPHTAGKVVFLEENDSFADGWGYNWGSWILNTTPGFWWDPLSGWYTGRATMFSFVDAHAEKKQWVDQSTFDMIEYQTIPQEVYAGEGEDLRWMLKVYHHEFPRF